MQWENHPCQRKRVEGSLARAVKCRVAGVVPKRVGKKHDEDIDLRVHELSKVL